MTHYVFVYGTLKRGHNNHHLLKGATYLGQYNTGIGYTKVVKGLPFLFEDGGPGCSGELYEVSTLTLNLLDRLEGHPDMYERKLINVSNDESTHTAWCYLMDKERVNL